MRSKEVARQFLQTLDHKVITLKQFEEMFGITDESTPPDYFSSYYRPENPKQIKKNKSAMEKFLLAPPKARTLRDRLTSFWR